MQTENLRRFFLNIAVYDIHIYRRRIETDKRKDEMYFKPYP